MSFLFTRDFSRIYTSTCFHIYVSGYIGIPSSPTINNFIPPCLYSLPPHIYPFINLRGGVDLFEPIVALHFLTPFALVRLKFNTPFLVRSVNRLHISSPFALTVCQFVGVGFAFTSCHQFATTFFLTVPIPRK